VIDADRGIVFGVTLLHYPRLPNQPRMYVSEVFQVVGGAHRQDRRHRPDAGWRQHPGLRALSGVGAGLENDALQNG
jgi:hypothetical protein